MENSNIGFRYGLIGGILLVFLFLGLYYSNPDLLFRRMGMLASFLLLLIMIWTGCAFQKQYQGVELLFRDMVRPIFTVFVVSIGMMIAFFYAFYNFLDPSIEISMRDWYLAEITHQMEQANKSAGFMKKELEALRNSDYSYGFFKALQTYVLSLVFGFLMAAAISVGFMYARLWKRGAAIPR